MAGSLQIVHVLPQRVRLRWPATLDPGAIDQLCAQLQGQPWLRQLQQRPASRSLVLLLEPGCPLWRWNAALAALGWRLEDPRSPADAAPASDAAESWLHLSRQVGGSMIGAGLGQLLLGGASASLAAAVAGPGAALVCGGVGAVLGAVLGSIVGTAVADGQATTLPHTLTQLTWRKLSTRMGEEVGSRSGVALGAALAGPVGAVAGLAVGSVLGGQVAHDLSGSTSARAGIGQRSWFVGMVRDSSGEALSERLGSSLGARLSGGSEVGRQLGGTLGHRFARRLDWKASLQQQHLVPKPAHQPQRFAGRNG